MPTTLCTCGCGQQVSYTTKQHHLNGHGKMTLRARIAAENEWLKSSTSQQPQISRKRSYSTSDQNSSRTRRKAAQVEIEEEPKVFPADADLMEPLLEPPGHVPETFPDADPVEPLLEPPGHVPETFPTDADPVEPLLEPPGHIPEIFPTDADPVEPLLEPPGHVPETFPTDADPVEPLLEPPGHMPETFPADANPTELLFPGPALNQVPETHHTDPDARGAHKSNWIAERMRRIVGERWGDRGLRNEDSNGPANNSSEDEALAVEPADPEAEDDLDNEDDEDDHSLLVESDVAGISAWDMLGEGFGREAISIGSFLLSQLSLPKLLTMIQMENP